MLFYYFLQTIVLKVKKSSFFVITVRAHLEQFEELLRMGVWDFMINMSGSDLSIRSASWIYVWFDFLL